MSLIISYNDFMTRIMESFKTYVVWSIIASSLYSFSASVNCI